LLGNLLEYEVHSMPCGLKQKKNRPVRKNRRVNIEQGI
jgi:hypothetical protein